MYCTLAACCSCFRVCFGRPVAAAPLRTCTEVHILGYPMPWQPRQAFEAGLATLQDHVSQHGLPSKGSLAYK